MPFGARCLGKRPVSRLLLGALLAGLLPALAVAGPVSARDDKGRQVALARPAERIVVLTPHATELVFAAGGGRRVVGAVQYSDYPVAARALPRVGDYARLDLERILALRPDLIVAWASGNPARQLDALGKLGIPIFYSEPRQLAQIPSNIERLGQLMGTTEVAREVARQQREQLAQLAARYSQRAPVTVFYQVGESPLFTLNGEHIVSEAIRLCGGRNVFAALKGLAPIVSVEAVLQKDPEVMVRGREAQEAPVAAGRKGRAGHGAPPDGGFASWHRYPSLLAVRRGNLFALDADLLSRPGPRLLEGAAQLCEKLELARQRRP